MSSFIAASAKFQPSDEMRRLVEVYVAVRVFARVQAAQAIVVEEAKAIVPVDTGELRESIAAIEPVDDGKTVTGSVVATAPHAAYVEYGTGQRGAASPGAGPFEYSPTWPGMPAQPYMRPALDSARGRILEGFQE